MARKSKHPLRLLALAGLLGVAACASSQVPMNQPLPTAQGNQVDRPQAANLAGGRADLLVLVSFSGGGKRSAAFGHGVLRGMREVPVRGAQGQSTLLEEVDQVAGVSGGSFPAAHFALNGPASFETFPEAFLYQDINAYIFGTYLLPWNWEWLVNPYFGTNDRMAEIYDRLVFRGATFADLERRGRPALSVNATDISFGLPFGFTPFNFDLICSDLASFPVARAVAASNGFPGLFTPITLRNQRDATCKSPPPLRPDAARARSDFRTRALAQSMDRYLSAQRTPWIHLMDGGIADNLAMRATLNTLALVEQQSDAFAELIRPFRRIVMISVDGQSATDPTLPQQRVVNGLTTIFGAVSGSQIDNYNVETLMLAQDQLDRLVRRLKTVRCAAAPVIAGQACDDVASLLVRISLSEYPDEDTRRELQAIPTGLTIERRFVDMLVAAGESMVRQEPTLAGFLQDRPTADTPTATRAPRRR